MTTVKKQLNAVIGFPLTHTKSPALHNVIYQKLGINATMKAISNPGICELIDIIKAQNIVLTAVTMPFKQSVMPFLDRIDKQAKAVNAVNTIINRHSLLTGYNTDVDGIAQALKKIPIKNKFVMIVGAGGAARAAAYYINNKKAKLLYLNRTSDKARLLKKKFGGVVINLKDLARQKVDIIINATPIGMYPKIADSPLPNYQFNKHQIVFDLVYNPLQTQLLKDAKKQGARTVSGIDMFIGQGVKQIELYSRKKIKSSIVRACREQLILKSNKI